MSAIDDLRTVLASADKHGEGRWMVHLADEELHCSGFRQNAYLYHAGLVTGIHRAGGG